MKAVPIEGKLMILPAAAGTCCMCATKHSEVDAHNIQSLFYATRFKAKYGRDPTFGDTVAHLTAHQQKLWKRAAMPVLQEHGIQWTEPADGNRIAEPYAESTGGR